MINISLIPTFTGICLMNNVFDNNFILDFGPKEFLHEKYNQVIIQAAGSGMKFVPLFGKILAELTIYGNTSYDISQFRSDRPGLII